jgi:hypothetical protein
MLAERRFPVMGPVSQSGASSFSARRTSRGRAAPSERVTLVAIHRVAACARPADPPNADEAMSRDSAGSVAPVAGDAVLRTSLAERDAAQPTASLSTTSRRLLGSPRVIAPGRRPTSRVFLSRRSGIAGSTELHVAGGFVLAAGLDRFTTS